MENAMDILTEKLVSTGMSKAEVDHLLARFLQEEAFQYVEYICNHLGELWREKGESSILPS
ncbi:MAG: hypothetical protein IJI66_00605 [Erysipelotrichaceae bacterium]|nr:hypothetical protein [Erysipelotrichaceae bacterium]